VRGRSGRRAVAILDEPEVTSVQDRVKGFKAAVAAGCPTVRIVADIDGGGERAKPPPRPRTSSSRTKISRHLRDQRRLRTRRGQGRRSRRPHGQDRVIGYDATPEARDAIKPARCTATRSSIPIRSARRRSMRSPIRSLENGAEESRVPSHVHQSRREIVWQQNLCCACEITKSFPGVRALDGVSFEVAAGEVHALVGENGAGKSTLMKVLAGAYVAESGTIEIDGQRVTIDGPKAAERLGIGMIYQEFNLVPDLGVIENIVLGIERRATLSRHRRRNGARDAVLAELGITLPLDARRGASRLPNSSSRNREGARAPRAPDRDGRTDRRADDREPTRSSR